MQPSCATEIYLLAGRMAGGRDPRCKIGSSVSFQAAASANRANAGSDFEPVFFMIEARWFSTVRWLMPRSAAIFLLGWPARTSSMIWRCRGVRLGDVLRRILSPGGQLARIPRLLERALDAGEQFVAADRLLDEIRRARLHGLNRHRHVAVAGDHDGRQPMARIAEPPQQFEPVHSGQVGIDHEACLAARTIGFEECLAGRIILDDPAIFLEHAANSLAYVAVVIDDEDDGRPGARRVASAGCGGPHMRDRLRCWQEALDRLCQLRATSPAC